MKDNVPDVRRGSFIRAKWLSQVARLTTRHDAAVHSNTSGTIHVSRFAGTRGFPNQRLLMVRMLRDLIPSFNLAGSLSIEHANEDETYRDAENAEILIWDSGDHAFKPQNGEKIHVWAGYGLPVRKGQQVLVRFDYNISGWVPTSQPETEMVRITNNVPNGDGLLEGVIQFWNDQTLLWEDATDPLTGSAIFVWVIDANA